MPWKSVQLSKDGSLLGGEFGGGSGKAELAAENAAVIEQFAQDQARKQAMEAFAPYQESCFGAARKLSEAEDPI